MFRRAVYSNNLPQKFPNHSPSPPPSLKPICLSSFAPMPLVCFSQWPMSPKPAVGPAPAALRIPAISSRAGPAPDAWNRRCLGAEPNARGRPAPRRGAASSSSSLQRGVVSHAGGSRLWCEIKPGGKENALLRIHVTITSWIYQIMIGSCMKLLSFNP